MKVAILAGGKGTRLAEETEVRPKPMVEVGGHPILWHIMQIYASYGFKEFAVALGYKGEFIKRWFVDYASLAETMRVDLASGAVTTDAAGKVDWTVDLVDTGMETGTGGRIKRLKDYVGDETFMLTWGDGVSDVPIDKLLEFHRSHGKACTLTAARPPARYGHMEFDGDRIVEFSEKPQTGEGWINGAFFVCEPRVFDFIPDDPEVMFERAPLEGLAAAGELMAFKHEGFWQCMDTLRDKHTLETIWESGNPTLEGLGLTTVAVAPFFEPFAELRDLPINVTALFGDRAAAKSAPRGDIVLGFDAVHGLVRNVAFDESSLDYDDTYENSQAFSPTFREFQTTLAKRLVETYSLHGGDIVEIGSGKGEFLTEIAEVAGGRGFGFDPTYAGQADDAAGDRVEFVVDRYDERYLDQPADLVACRHVLEHLDDPGALLTSLRSVLDARPDTVVYFEVPNLADILAGGGMWDVIYQHVWYFGAAAMQWLFESHGFEVLDIRTPFGGAFLSVEARIGAPTPTDVGAQVDETAVLVESFADRLAERREHWGGELAAAREAGQRVALWGAGAKGVTFLNAVDPEAQIDLVVDLNPRKRGSFVPGTGQQIVGPDDPAIVELDRVLIMNPNYADEIEQALRSAGSRASVEIV